jgi:hypothetical protein
MKAKFSSPLFFFLSYLLAFFLYFEALQGTPLWDDYSFWFTAPEMTPNYPYFLYWRNFLWPLSVSMQKFLLTMWADNYLYYHLFNLLLHFVNAYLIFALGKQLKLPFARWLFLFFLLHPANVISVSWMVQLKTLMCFFFSFSSLLLFLKAHNRIIFMLPSWLFFWASLVSKSSVLPLPLVLLLLSWKRLRGLQYLYLLPFFLLAAHGTYKMTSSSMALKGVSTALESTKQMTDAAAKIDPPSSSSPAAPPESPPAEATPSPTVKKPELKKEPDIVSTPDAIVNWALVPQTLHYYFWQAVVPVNNIPIRGPNYDGFSWDHAVHLFFLILLVIILRRDSALIYLLGGHLMLTPFLGIIPAPFMNVTWVSDQHLYLALPFLLIFWLKLFEKLPLKRKLLLLLPMLMFFSINTWRANQYYRNQETFFRVSVEDNPYNLAIVYNLSFLYLAQDRFSESYNLLSNTIDIVESTPMLKNNRYYPHVLQLHLYLRASLANPPEKEEAKGAP